MPKLSGPAYRIVTPRLVLRCWSPTDAPLLKATIDQNIEYLRPWLYWAEQEPTDIDIKINLLRRFRAHFDLGEDYAYGIFDPQESQVLGGTGLHTRAGKNAREIGYWITHERAGQGLATEAAAALTRVGFEVDGLQRIEIRCDPTNLASAAVIRKLGYTQDGLLRKNVQKPDGDWRDQMVWSMLASHYPISPCPSISISAFDCLGRQLL